MAEEIRQNYTMQNHLKGKVPSYGASNSSCASSHLQNRGFVRFGLLPRVYQLGKLVKSALQGRAEQGKAC